MGYGVQLSTSCCDDGLLGKALCSYVDSLDPEVSGYLVARTVKACVFK